jgi:hypothetical protein
MSDIAKGAVIGVIVAILLLGVLAEWSGILNRPAAAPGGPLAFEVTRIGPDGKPDTPYGEELTDAEIPGSAGYLFCMVSETRIQRPGMMVSNMPDGFCRLSRGDGGKWLISTGGWQECEVSCLKAAGG